MNIVLLFVGTYLWIVDILTLVVVTNFLHFRLSSLTLGLRFVYQLPERKELLATDFSVAKA